MNKVKSVFSIKDLENLSGIKAHTIRIWEKRYNIIEPKRTDTNIRYYTDNDLKKIPVVVLTATEDDHTKDQCANQGVEHYIRKPVNLDKFLEVVKKLKHHWLHDLILPSLE